jgi:hypothetical protein
MTAGTISQLVATGALDAYLSDMATHTHWKGKYNRHTRFAFESVSQPFNTSVSFGGECQATLNRVGDLVYYLYLNITLPGLVACDNSTDSSCPGVVAGNQFPVFMDQACAPCAKNDEAAIVDYLDADFDDADSTTKVQLIQKAKEKWAKEKYGAGSALDCCAEPDDCPDAVCPELGNVWCHYTNDVGHFLVRQARLVIGGQTVDTIVGDMMYCWEELTGKSGRRLTELVGRRYTRSQLICDSRERQQLYVPLPYWFTLASGSALSLASLAYHGVQLWVDFERLEKLVVVSSPNVSVVKAQEGCCLTNSDLVASLEITYVFLDNLERDKFAQNHFEQLVVQNQSFYMTTSSSQVRLNLSFNHPCLELFWGIRRQCQERCNNWGNLSGVDGRDPLVSAQLLLNSQSRWGTKPALYFRGVQPFQHHSNIPDAFIYVFSFALDPENSTSPSGTCNMSRIDHVELILQLQDALAKETCTVFVFARNFNILRFREGVAGLAYN